MRHVANALVLAGMLSVAGAAHAEDKAQQAQAPGTKAQGKTMDFRGMSVPTDEKQFVERMLSMQQEILKEAKMVERSSQSQQVKEFGGTLTQTHQRLSDRLKQHLKDQKLQAGTFKAQTDAERSTASAEKATQSKLQTLSGDAFDQAFLAAQLNDHDRLIMSALAGQQQFSGQPLGTLLQEVQPELTRLRERAYQLLGQQGASMGTGGAGQGQDTGGSGVQQDSGKKQ